MAWTEAPQSVADALKQRRRWALGTVQLLFALADILGRRTAGPVGMLGLPSTMITQMLLPAAAPIADVYLLYLSLRPVSFSRSEWVTRYRHFHPHRLVRDDEEGSDCVAWCPLRSDDLQGLSERGDP